MISLGFNEPVVLNKKIENNKLVLKLDWTNQNEKQQIGTTIISKDGDSFIYEDIGFTKRKFQNIDVMFWEFELPNSLRCDVLKLK